MKVNKNVSRIIASIICFSLTMALVCSTSFASESNSTFSEAKNDTYEAFEAANLNSDSELGLSTVSDSTIADFSGVYYGWLDVPFTINDSSRTVKVMFATYALNDSAMVTSVGIKKSSSTVWFWTQNEQPGNKQIYTVGRLETGDYVLRIKTNQTAAGYSISGQVYYF